MNVFSVLVLDDNCDFQVSLNTLRCDPCFVVVHVDVDLKTVVVKSTNVLGNNDFDSVDGWVVVSSNCVSF